MLSDEVQREILARPEWKAKKRGGRVHFRCPRHEDAEPSAWTGGGAWGCFACGFEEPITTLAEALGMPLSGSGDYTLEDYADAKGFSVETLRQWGLETVESKGHKVVRIPYFDADGNELRARLRSRTGKWWEGKDRPIYLYGQDRLTDAKPGEPVLIVEGESDCHALWSAGMLAVGVPGATSWRPDWSPLLNGLRVYVWEEPDQGGAQMVERLVQSFPAARILHANGSKDPCDMRAKVGDGFVTELESMMRQARPHNAPEPPVAFDVLDRARFRTLLEHQLAPIDAVPTPFPAWNRASRDAGGGTGLARGWHVLAAARTGVGKSILALNMAAEAMRNGETVCFISLEMSQEQVETRLMSIVSRMPVEEIEKGAKFQRDRFVQAVKAFDSLPGSFVTNRSALYTVADVVRAIVAVHEIHGARYFIVDYLQLAGNANDPESITAVSHAVRQQARDLKVVTFGLSQFNRSTSSLNETPNVHGLMGGSALENDADQVVLIDHSKVAENLDDEGRRTGWTTDLLLSKNRHGPPGQIPMGFSSKTLCMWELYDDEIPANIKRR